MDLSECAKILLNRIRQVEPSNASKIFSYLLLNHPYPQIMQYAFGSEEQIRTLIVEAKSFLKSTPQPFSLPLSPPPPPLPPPSPGYDWSMPCWEPQFMGTDNVNGLQSPVSPTGPIGALQRPVLQSVGLEDQLKLLNILGGHEGNMLGNYPNTCLNGIGHPFGSSDSPTRPCQYFLRGFCKNGLRCRFFHGSGLPEVQNECQNYSFGSLGKLEMEIRELLISRGGMPVSIASLPMLYLERYGKALKADGYLTESQRHGKAGCSLTRLLLRFKAIRVIERPHGQHAVVLVEDANKYLEYKSDGCDLMDAGGDSNQIYLTFPPESTFTDEQICNYFKQYGPVCDVRIPHQEKRMFGFVGFLYPETVRLVLAKGTPHFICGARVLVKPYKEKPKPNDRKHAEKDAHFNHCAHRISDATQEHHTAKLPSPCEFFQKKLHQGCELGIDVEAKNSLVLEAASSPVTNEPSPDSLQEAQNFLEGDNLTKLSHELNESDDASPEQDSGEVKLPDSLDLY